MGFGKITSPFRSGGGWPSTERKDASVLQYCGGRGLLRRVERERLLTQQMFGIIETISIDDNLRRGAWAGPNMPLWPAFWFPLGEGRCFTRGPIDTHTPTLPTVIKIASNVTERGPKSPQKAIKWSSKNLVTPKQTFGGRSKASRSSNRCIAYCCMRLDWTSMWV